VHSSGRAINARTPISERLRHDRKAKRRTQPTGGSPERRPRESRGRICDLRSAFRCRRPRGTSWVVPPHEGKCSVRRMGGGLSWASRGGGMDLLLEIRTEDVPSIEGRPTKRRQALGPGLSRPPRECGSGPELGGARVEEEARPECLNYGRSAIRRSRACVCTKASGPGCETTCSAVSTKVAPGAGPSRGCAGPAATHPPLRST